MNREVKMTPNKQLELTCQPSPAEGGYYVLHFAPHGRGKLAPVLTHAAQRSVRRHS